MHKRRLGRTDLLVTQICLGSMTWGQQNTEAEGHAQMDLAFSRGVKARRPWLDRNLSVSHARMAIMNTGRAGSTTVRASGIEIPLPERWSSATSATGTLE